MYQMFRNKPINLCNNILCRETLGAREVVGLLLEGEEEGGKVGFFSSCVFEIVFFKCVCFYFLVFICICSFIGPKFFPHYAEKR